MSGDLTSEIILRRIRDHDSGGAWRAFFERYEPMLRHYAYRFGVHGDHTQDVIQETLLAVLEGMRQGKYDESRGSLRDWLKGIAVNKIREARRKLNNREHQVPDNPQSTGFMNHHPDEHDDLEDAFEQEWQRAVLAESLRRVKSEVQNNTYLAFVRYAIEGKSVDDVADETGISKEMIYIAKSRIMKRLRYWKSELEESLVIDGAARLKRIEDKEAE